MRQPVPIKVAIKLIKPKYRLNREVWKLFESEAQLLYELKHNHICRLIGAWMTCNPDASIYPTIVTEFLPYKLTYFTLDHPDQITMMQFHCIFFDLAGVLFWLQNKESSIGKRISHNDLTPNNIMLTEDMCVKLIDFGLSKIHQQSMSTHEGARNHPAGTPGYIVCARVFFLSINILQPREVFLEGTRRYTDIFAFGVTFYTSLVGNDRPYGDQSPSSIRKATVAGNLPDLSNFSFLHQALIRMCLISGLRALQN
jgi:serine/threonine protein kinase